MLCDAVHDRHNAVALCSAHLRDAILKVCRKQLELHDLTAAQAAQWHPSVMGSSTANANDLGKAKRAVAATMKLKMSKLLFNQPVDPEALGLPNYFDVVKQPMDLGTIFDKLSSAERQDWQESEYESAAEVFRDVSQVWQNCVLYNSRDVDKPTRDVALDVKAAFELNWKEVGLEKASPERQDATADCLVESSVPQTVGSVQGERLDRTAANIMCNHRRWQPHHAATLRGCLLSALVQRVTDTVLQQVSSIASLATISDAVVMSAPVCRRA